MNDRLEVYMLNKVETQTNWNRNINNLDPG